MAIRVAPDGARVEVHVPEEFGEPAWFGITRLAGPRVQRDFHLAPVGQHRHIPTKLMPGASVRTFSRHGYDVLLYEAADRSDSCLVWVGPYHEATTWFGAAAPRPDLISSLINLVRYEDAPAGARLVSRSPRLTQQYGTVLTAWSEWAWLGVRSAAEGAGVLPDWQGMIRGDREIWRSERSLEDADRGRLSGTPYQWRYLIAGPDSVAEVTLHPPGSPLRPTGLADDPERRVAALVDGLRVGWGR